LSWLCLWTLLRPSESVPHPPSSLGDGFVLILRAHRATVSRSAVGWARPPLAFSDQTTRYIHRVRNRLLHSQCIYICRASRSRRAHTLGSGNENLHAGSEWRNWPLSFCYGDSSLPEAPRCFQLRTGLIFTPCVVTYNDAKMLSEEERAILDEGATISLRNWSRAALFPRVLCGTPPHLRTSGRFRRQLVSCVGR